MNLNKNYNTLVRQQLRISSKKKFWDNKNADDWKYKAMGKLVKNKKQLLKLLNLET
jgi:hypothetical protein